jgi:hypothetical protein
MIQSAEQNDPEIGLQAMRLPFSRGLDESPVSDRCGRVDIAPALRLTGLQRLQAYAVPQPIPQAAEGLRSTTAPDVGQLSRHPLGPIAVNAVWQQGVQKNHQINLGAATAQFRGDLNCGNSTEGQRPGGKVLRAKPGNGVAIGVNQSSY